MGDDAPIRPVTAEELPAFARTVALQFGETLSDELLEVLRDSTELDRTFAWFEGDKMMGTAETVSFDMSLPGGGTVACAGLTSVGVNPLRRRRGILTALMRRQLDQAHEREEPVGALYASESGIYGRYGYGAAAPSTSIEIPTARAALRRPAAEAGPLELLDVDDALERLPAIYERARGQRPGAMNRAPERWRAFLGYDPEGERRGYSARFHVVLEDRGYLVYRIKDEWSEGAPDGRLQVVELVTLDAGAHATLWQLCLSMDLVDLVEAEQRPPDDPVLLELVDPVRARVRPGAPLWVRVISVPETVAARGYAGEGGAVVAIADAACPWNAGTWRLELGPEGGSATRTAASPDLSMDVAELGCAYLGGIRLSALVAARRVHEHRAGAAWALDRLMAADPLPWNPRMF
jgi:predicted acetyltransferase